MHTWFGRLFELRPAAGRRDAPQRSFDEVVFEQLVGGGAVPLVLQQTPANINT